MAVRSETENVSQIFDTDAETIIQAGELVK